VSEVLGARDRAGQDAKVRMLFASLLNYLVGYHDTRVSRYMCIQVTLWWKGDFYF
jgi:hypothetical protein